MTPKRKVAGKIPRKDPFRYRYGGSFGPVPGNSKHRRHKRNGTPFHSGFPGQTRSTLSGGFHNRDFVCGKCRAQHTGPGPVQHCGEEMFEVPSNLRMPKPDAPKKVWKTFLAQVQLPIKKAKEAEARENVRKMEQRLSSYVDAIAVVGVLQDKIVTAEKYGHADDLKEIDDDLSIVGLTSKHCDTLIKTGQLLKIRLAAQKVREALVS